jgi:asparagine synthase (glutamine-hydrolysing)
MPGILGIIRSGVNRQNGDQLKDMLKCMLHEPFYKSGTLVEEGGGGAFGWVAFEGCNGQPAWNKAGTIGLLLAGEQFSGDGSEDASGLLPLFEEQGMRFLERLNGFFSGILIDRRENKIFLFNDRFGLGRIYYHESPDGFYFSSEAKSLLAVLPQLRSLDMRGLGEYFSCSCVLQNRTLFSGVSLLPPGSLWTFQRGHPLEKAAYFSKSPCESQPVLSPDEYFEKLKETFARILPKYFKGDRRIALSLTGGLDSRMVIAGAPRPPNGLPCYTFGGLYRECADVRIARQVAARCQQPHQVIVVDKSFFSEFPALAGRSVYCSDGAMDVTGAVELFINKAARKIAPVRLTGNYGDEILRGNVTFKPDPLCPGLFDGEFAAQLRGAAETYAAEKQGPLLSFIAFKQVPWFHYCRLAVEQTQVTMRSPYLDHELLALAYRAPEGLTLNRALAYRVSAESAPALAGLPTDRGLGFKPGIVPDKTWRWIREFMPRAEYVYDYGMPQWLARVNWALAPLRLEKLFLGRQKFFNFRPWYRHELAGYVKEMLLDARTLGRPYLQGRRVEQIVREHTSGRGNYTREIHKLLSSELLQRQLIEAI